MGDSITLAQELYTTFVNSGEEVAGSDVPNWASLPSSDRERWEQVAARARRRFEPLKTALAEACQIAARHILVPAAGPTMAVAGGAVAVASEPTFETQTVVVDTTPLFRDRARLNELERMSK